MCGRLRSAVRALCAQPFSAVLGAIVENLTHSLVGLLCAEVAVRLRDRRREVAAWPRAGAYAIAIIANNAPDIDFTYAGISGKRFGYLLQHRGYTHTLPAALGFALLMLGVLWALGKWRKKSVRSEDWWLLAGLALLSRQSVVLERAFIANRRL
jgi:inner membrane protein